MAQLRLRPIAAVVAVALLPALTAGSAATAGDTDREEMAVAAPVTMAAGADLATAAEADPFIPDEPLTPAAPAGTTTDQNPTPTTPETKSEAVSGAEIGWRRAAMRVDPVTVPLVVATDATDLGPLELQRATSGVGDAAPTLVAGTASTEPFVLIGFSWEGPAGVSARFRVHNAAGWSDWRPLVRGDGHGPDDDPDAPEPGEDPAGEDRPTALAGFVPPTGRATTDPVWVGLADGWQIGIDGTASGLVANLVRPEAGPTPDAVTPGEPAVADGTDSIDAAGFGPQRTSPLANVTVSGTEAAPDGSSVATLRPARAAERPEIGTRSSWGARPPADDTWTAQSLRLTVVHHTGSGDGSSYAAADVPAMLRAIQAYHMDANGWTDIGYNFAVDRFGRIWEARDGGIDALTVGAQAEGMNTGAAGVVILGDFSSAAPSGPALDAVARLLAWKLFRHGADPERTGTMLPRTNDLFSAGVPVSLPRVVGHRDVNSTACPGNVELFLPQIRSAVTARYNALLAATTTLADDTVSLAGRGRPAIADVDKDGRDDVFWYRPGPEPDELWRSTATGGFLRSSYTVADDGVVNTRMTQLDWDGDGTGDLLFSTPGRSSVTLLLGSRDGTLTTRTMTASGDAVPVAGDFDGDGDDEVLFYRPGVVTLPLAESTSTGSAAMTNLSLTGGPYRPVAGDFDGDLRDDVLWYGPGGTADVVWTSRGGRAFDSRSVTIGGDYQPVVADLDGDQRADVVWTKPGGGMVPLWYGGAAFNPVSIDVGPTVSLRFADVDGGGTADMITVDADGVATVSLRRAAGESVLRQAPVATGAVPLPADLDGDGRRELWWWVDGETAALWRPS